MKNKKEDSLMQLFETMSHDISFITHFAMVNREEPMYSTPPDARSEGSRVYPAGFIPSAPSQCSTIDVARLSEFTSKEESEAASFTFSPSITLPSTAQFPATPTPWPSSLFVNCPSLGPSKKKPFTDFFQSELHFKKTTFVFIKCFYET